MFRLAQNTVAAMLIAILAFSAVTPVTTPPASAAYPGEELIDCVLMDGLECEAFDCGVLHGSECFHVQDAQTWSFSVTAWKFPNDQFPVDDMADAFRHCSWMGALATRLGSSEAYTIGFIHEDAGDRHGQSQSSRLMDEWNNFVGVGIGDAAVQSGVSDQWGYIMDECYSLAVNYELYGPDGIVGSYESSL